MKEEKFLHYQHKVLKSLANKIDDFYLAGGTALSLFYFQHRISVDLDFFTQRFSYERINEIVSCLTDNLKKEIKLIAQYLQEDKTRMLVYYVYFTQEDAFKIDFVEDVFPLTKDPKFVDGIKILSLEDIYLRKIYALIGVLPVLNNTGRKRFIGGRSEAKDFFDLYFLSHTFMPLCDFVEKFGNPVIKEGLINWYRTFDRITVIDEILRLKTDKKIDYKIMEKHLHEEIDRIVEKQIGEI
jgi:hypothetical protein